VAWRITEFEMSRTQSEFDTSYTYKAAVFQFFNYFSALFYFTFVRGVLFIKAEHDPALDNRSDCPLGGAWVDIIVQTGQFFYTG
jgi:hypothetical protein